MTGFEPVPQGLEGPQATVTPHSLWIGLNVSDPERQRSETGRLARSGVVRNPSLHAGNVGCILHTQAEHGRVALTGPSTSVSFQRPRSFELVGGKGFEPNRPLGRTGLRPVSGPSARTTRLATAPGFEPGPASFGGSDAPVTPRCPRRLTSWPCRRHTLPVAWPVFSYGLEAKTKRPSRGSP